MALASLILVCIAGCDALRLNNHRAVDIQTDRDRYSMSGNKGIVIQAANTSGRILYQYTPPDAVLEKREDGSWREIGPWYATVAVVPRSEPVLPGESFTIPGIPAGEFKYFDIQPGIYRVKTHIYRSSKMKVKLPLEQRVSNPFELTK